MNPPSLKRIAALESASAGFLLGGSARKSSRPKACSAINEFVRGVISRPHWCRMVMLLSAARSLRLRRAANLYTRCPCSCPVRLARCHGGGSRPLGLARKACAHKPWLECLTSFLADVCDVLCEYEKLLHTSSRFHARWLPSRDRAPHNRAASRCP